MHPPSLPLLSAPLELHPSLLLPLKPKLEEFATESSPEHGLSLILVEEPLLPLKPSPLEIPLLLPLMLLELQAKLFNVDLPLLPLPLDLSLHLMFAIKALPSLP